MTDLNAPEGEETSGPLDEIVGRRAPPHQRNRAVLPPLLARAVGFLGRFRPGRRLLAEALRRRTAAGDRDGVFRLAETIARTVPTELWAGEAFVAGWRGGGEAVRAEVGRFLAELVPPEAGPPPADDELVVILPGVLRRDLSAAMLGVSPAARVLDLAGALADADALPFTPIRVPLTAREISEEWFERATAAADRTQAMLERALAGTAAGRDLATHREIFAFQLRHEIAWVLRPMELMHRVIAEGRPRRVRFIEGHYPSAAFRAEAAANGITPDRMMVIATDPWSRTSGPPRGVVRKGEASAGEALATAVSGRRAVVCPWSAKGRAVVVADLRQPLDFRHYRGATAILAAIAGRREAILLQPIGRFNLRLAKVVARLLRLHGTAVRPAVVRNPQIVSRFLGGVADWRTPLLRTIVREVMPRDARAVADLAAVLEATGIHLCGQLPGALAVLADLDRLFARAPPAHVCAVPTAKAVPTLVIGAARARGIPTMEVQTLLIGTSNRDWRPIADRVAVLDDSQAELNVRRFAIPPERMILAGREGLHEDRRAGLAHRRAGGGRRNVVFVSQPLAALTAATLDAVLAACAGRTDVDLLVVAHPDEDAATRAAQRAAIAASPMAARVRLAPAGETTRDLLEADVVVTIVSNVGMRAAIMERDVLVVNLSGADLPIRFDASGLALYADTPEAVAERIDALFDDPVTRADLAERRAAYLRRNSHFVSGPTAEHVADALEAMAAPSTPA
ncbi:MAG: hypothetical protein OEL76_10260 [Siculibacillus sp.]|nr:hypothetical protein [Siculibacillus sp.]